MSDDRHCEHCSAPLVRNDGEQPSKWLLRRFCNRTCARRFRGVRMRKEVPDRKPCQFCGEMFDRPAHTADWLWERRQCCSNSCAAKARHVRQSAASPHNIAKARSGWQKGKDKRLAERHEAAERQARERPQGPKFATQEEWLAYHGVERAREGITQYSAAKAPLGGIPVHPMSLGGGRVGGGRR